MDKISCTLCFTECTQKASRPDLYYCSGCNSDIMKCPKCLVPSRRNCKPDGSPDVHYCNGCMISFRGCIKCGGGILIGNHMYGSMMSCDLCGFSIRSSDPLIHPNKSKGCYIATCVYGSYDCQELWTLRRYRDTILDDSWLGRRFIRMYYSVSPKIVEVFGNKKWFNNLFKPIITNVVERLRKQGVDNAPYEDK